MRRLLGLLASLLLILSLGVGSVAHATECTACMEAVDGGIHMPGDADEVPSDSEKDYPHHHGGCHGHHIAASLDEPATSFDRLHRDAPPAGAVARLASATLDAALRPPRA